MRNPSEGETVPASEREAPPKLVLFDLGNVILLADHELTYKRLTSLHDIPKEKASNFFTIPQYQEFERGKVTGRDFYEVLVAAMGKRVSYEEMVAAHDVHIYGIDQDVLDLIRKIPQDQIGFATDTNEWQTRRQRELIDLTPFSNLMFCSNELGMMKADEDFFPTVLSRFGLNPEEVLLVDDSIEKVDMAKKHGVRTIQFTNSSKLAVDLERVRIL